MHDTRIQSPGDTDSPASDRTGSHHRAERFTCEKRNANQGSLTSESLKFQDIRTLSHLGVVGCCDASTLSTLQPGSSLKLALAGRYKFTDRFQPDFHIINLIDPAYNYFPLPCDGAFSFATSAQPTKVPALVTERKSNLNIVQNQARRVLGIRD